jgi:hypothetical protein
MLIALLAATYANPDGSNVRPSVARLGREAGFKVHKTPRGDRCRPATAHLSKLVRLGWLGRIAPGGAGRATVYSLMIPNRALHSTVTPGSDPASGSAGPCSQQPGHRAITSAVPSQDHAKTTTSPEHGDDGHADEVALMLGRIHAERPLPVNAVVRVRELLAKTLAAGWTSTQLAMQIQGFATRSENPAGALIRRLELVVLAEPAAAPRPTRRCPEHPGVGRRRSGECAGCWIDRRTLEAASCRPPRL